MKKHVQENGDISGVEHVSNRMQADINLDPAFISRTINECKASKSQKKWLGPQRLLDDEQSSAENKV